MKNASPTTMTADEALSVLQKHFLGSDYYIADPVHATQANAIIVEDIIKMHPLSYDQKKEKHEHIKKIFFNVSFVIILIIMLIETIYLYSNL